MSRRKLTPDEKELFTSMLSYSTRMDRLRIFWWGLVSRSRQWALMDRLWDGMSWHAAMKEVVERPGENGSLYDFKAPEK